MVKTCEVCGSEYEASREHSRTCSTKCRMKLSRESVTVEVESVTESVTEIPESVTEAKCNNESVTDYNPTFMGKPVKELDQYFKIGDDRYCELLGCRSTFHASELPYWLLEDDLERDKLPLAKSIFLKPQEKRRRFRDMMLSYDSRFGARGQDGQLIAR